MATECIGRFYDYRGELTSDEKLFVQEYSFTWQSNFYFAFVLWSKKENQFL